MARIVTRNAGNLGVPCLLMRDQLAKVLSQFEHWVNSHDILAAQSHQDLGIFPVSVDCQPGGWAGDIKKSMRLDPICVSLLA